MINYHLNGRAKLEKARKIARKRDAANAAPIWRPNPGPQTAAYNSPADVIGYGGAAGGGKTDLILGLAGTKHQRSVIFRRVSPNLRGIIERSREIFNPIGPTAGKDSYNETLKRWKLENPNRLIELESCQYDHDKEKQRGRPRDLMAFDEVTEFTRSIIEFITAWNRTTDPNQKTRIVFTFNPPTDEAGGWIVDYFLPFFAYLYPDKFTHSNPAAPGELRYYATIDGRETELDNGDPFLHDGEEIRPQSRTFILAKLEDNPYLSNTNYRSRLQSLPEPLRSQLLYGDFTATGKADPWQVIPLSWIQAAQKRWLETAPPTDRPLTAVGVDVARGGADSLAICKRYGSYFSEIEEIPGVNVEDGPAAAAMVYQSLEAEGKAPGAINLDVIGVGTSAYDSTKAIYPGITHPINAAAGSNYTVKDSNNKALLRMKNTRAAYHWQLREALDPINGRSLAIPNDPELLKQLAAPRYKMLAGGVIQIEKKDDIKKRTGRSPDLAEALMLALYDAAPLAPAGARTAVNTDKLKTASRSTRRPLIKRGK